MKLQNISTLGLSLILGIAIAGCEEKIAEEREVDVKPGGTVVEERRTVTEQPDGTIVEKETKEVDRPEDDADGAKVDVDVDRKD